MVKRHTLPCCLNHSSPLRCVQVSWDYGKCCVWTAPTFDPSPAADLRRGWIYAPSLPGWFHSQFLVFIAPEKAQQGQARGSKIPHTPPLSLSLSQQGSTNCLLQRAANSQEEPTLLVRRHHHIWNLQLGRQFLH